MVSYAKAWLYPKLSPWPARGTTVALKTEAFGKLLAKSWIKSGALSLITEVP
jgi:hypothetical protein